VGGTIYHVLNRANARMTLFENAGDYEAFLKAFAEAHQRVTMRTLAYCIMPNHWHLVLWPHYGADLSTFMKWLTMTHAERWHAFRGTTGTGHLYQGRFKNFPVEDDKHYLTVCRYVEANPVRAGLVSRAEDWRWSSLWVRLYGDPEQRQVLREGPLALPDNWLDLVNEPLTEKSLQTIRQGVERGRPFGSALWIEKTARRLHLSSTLRPRGRPKKGSDPFFPP
jgi:putative transposase